MLYTVQLFLFNGIKIIIIQFNITSIEKTYLKALYIRATGQTIQRN